MGVLFRGKHAFPDPAAESGDTFYPGTPPSDHSRAGAKLGFP